MRTFRGKPEEYEKWYYTRYGSRIAKKELDAVVDLVGGRKLLLDIGCGTGFFAEKLSSLGYKVFGVDVDEEMLRYASLKSLLPFENPVTINFALTIESGIKSFFGHNRIPYSYIGWKHFVKPSHEVFGFISLRGNERNDLINSVNSSISP